MTRRSLVGLGLGLGIGSLVACVTPTSSVEPDSTPQIMACEDRVIYTDERPAPFVPSAYAHRTTTAVLTYDSAGRVVGVREENDAGDWIASVRRTWDGRSRPLLRERTAAASPIHSLMAWTYYDGIHEVRTDYTELWKPGSISVTTAGQRYDAAGRLVLAWAAAERRSDVTYTWSDANTVLATTVAAGLIQRIELTAGRFVTRVEHLTRGRVDSVERTTYDADLHPTARIDESSAGTTTTFVDWEAGRVRAVRYPSRRVEFTWDARGKMATRRELGADPSKGTSADVTTTFTWDGDAFVSAERKQTQDGVLLQRWRFDRGCAGAVDLEEPQDPTGEWRRELVTVPFWYDFVAIWNPTGS